MILRKRTSHTGFTLVELMVSVAIFALLTALVVARYGTFNQGILLTNLAYDIALTIRTAQTYGLNVRSAPTAGATFSGDFQSAYGVHFQRDAGQIIFFSDSNGDYAYTASNDVRISTYTLKRGSRVSGLCTSNGNSGCTSRNVLDISFKRPDPVAIINAGNSHNAYAMITIQSTDGGTKNIVVRDTGQISIEN